MDVYVLLQWRKAAKGRWRFAKGLNTTIYKPINKRKPDHIPMSRFCWGAKGRERCAKRGVRAVFGYIILDNPTYIYMIICIILYNIYIYIYIYIIYIYIYIYIYKYIYIYRRDIFLGMFFFQSWAFFLGFCFPSSLLFCFSLSAFPCFSLLFCFSSFSAFCFSLLLCLPAFLLLLNQACRIFPKKILN